MRSMGHPDYTYSPWTPERRAQASNAAKARIEAQRQITAESFISELRGLIEQAQATDEKIERMLCAVGYVQAVFPSRAQEIEELYRIAAQIVRWE